MTILYIIGNGFDLHHEIQTHYKNFGVFLKLKHNELYQILEEYFPVDSENYFWGHFEENLAAFDVHHLIDTYEPLIIGYGTKNWSDAYHHNHSYELDRVTQAMSNELLNAFIKWISQIQIPSINNSLKLPFKIDATTQFITFNYTSTLQQLYGIPSDQIWHIHGSADNPSSIVLGHGWQPTPSETWLARLDMENEDSRRIEGAQIIDQYFRSSFKPTTQIIESNVQKFKALSEINDVRVLGHSLSNVDLPYFKEIANNIKSFALWRISFHNNSAELEEQFVKFAEPSQSSYHPITSI